jgi:hypothetical protein
VPEVELPRLLAQRQELKPSLLHQGGTVWDAI